MGNAHTLSPAPCQLDPQHTCKLSCWPTFSLFVYPIRLVTRHLHTTCKGVGCLGAQLLSQLHLHTPRTNLFHQVCQSTSLQRIFTPFRLYFSMTVQGLNYTKIYKTQTAIGDHHCSQHFASPQIDGCLDHCTHTHQTALERRAQDSRNSNQELSTVHIGFLSC